MQMLLLHHVKDETRRGEPVVVNADHISKIERGPGGFGAVLVIGTHGLVIHAWEPFTDIALSFVLTRFTEEQEL